jgi:hypothetical protein
LKSVELGSEGGVSLGALLGFSSQVRGGPWPDAEHGGEVREPEGGLVSRQPGQRQACWNSPLASQLVGVNSEFGCDNPLNHLESGSNGRPLRAWNLSASAASSNQLLDVPAEVFTAQEDLRPKLLPRRVSRPLPLGDELSIARPRHLLASEDKLCPVCGFELGFEAWRGDSASHEICPSCGIEFGYDDNAGGSLEKRKEIWLRWRATWIKRGMPWSSTGSQPPLEWSPEVQLARVTGEGSGNATGAKD